MIIIYSGQIKLLRYCIHGALMNEAALASGNWTEITATA